jgi:hypothetical protein
MPAGEYLSLNSSYFSDPGAQSRLIAELPERPPVVFVATGPVPAQAQRLLADDRYRDILGTDGGSDPSVGPRSQRLCHGFDNQRFLNAGFSNAGYLYCDRDETLLT